MTTIYGWDLSHYDGPDSRRAIDQGFTFFTHKAGGDANDAELGAWWSLMRGYRDRVLLGAYWVLYPGTPRTRAAAFLARLESQCPGWRDAPFILQADCEIWGGDRGTLPGRADIQNFCDALREAAPKLRPIVYAPKWAYGNTLAGLTYPLWASSYVTGEGAASALYPGDNSSRWGSYSGQTPAVLQFTSSATIAGQTTCDANAFRGTLAQLQTIVAPGWAQEEEAMAFIDTQEKLNAAMATAMTAYFTEQQKDGANVVGGCVTGHRVGNSQSTVGLLLAAAAGNSTSTLAQLAGQTSTLAALLKFAQGEAAEVPPTAQAIADAVYADIDGLSAADAAQALAAVYTPDKLAALITALQALARTPPPAARGEGDPADPQDIYTQVMREQQQARIQGDSQ